jgi:bla regulator protein blaR1
MEWINLSLVQNLGLTLLHFIWQGALIGVLYSFALALLRPSRAATRYNLAVATLLTLAITPVLTLVWLQQAASNINTAMAGPAEILTIAAGHSGISEPGAISLLAWVVGIWLLGVAVMSVRLLLGWHYILTLRRSADRLAASHLEPLLERLKHQLRVTRRVQIAVSRKVCSPVVVGWLKPMILFPPALINHLPIQQIEMVLAHELAHIRRHDHLINLIQTTVETLLFYHPVVAWVSRRIRIERENACDDLAVDATRNRLAYVEMLATLEQLRHPGTRLALAIHDGQILGRIRRLVEQARPARQKGLTIPALLLITLAAGAAGLHFLPEKSEPESPEISIDNLTAIESAAIEPAVIEAPPDRATPSPMAEEEIEWQAPSRPEPVLTEMATQPTHSPSTDPAAMDEIAVDQPEMASEPTRDSLRDGLTETTQPSTDPVRTGERPVGQAEHETPIRADGSAPLQMAAANLPPPATGRMEPEPLVSVQPPPITGGELVHQVQPDFPARARQRRSEGLVKLEFLVDRRGTVSDIQIISEIPGDLNFAKAARTAVSQWRFEPFHQGEEAIERRVRVEVEFNPDDACLNLLGSRIPRC